MLTLFHAPMSRSTRLVQLIDELGALDRVTIREVGIVRFDGSGAGDPVNPHPEGKVPCLVHDGVEIWESTAIALYLTEQFPAAGLGVAAGEPLRGRFLAWLAWYGAVLEPVVVFRTLGIESPALARTFRGLDEAHARLAKALAAGPWLVGDRYTAADLIVASAFAWKPEMAPADAAVQDWLGRCKARPSSARAMARDRPQAA